MSFSEGTNPVNVEESFTFTCTDQGGGTIVHTVNGLESGPLYDRLMVNSNPTLTVLTFTFPNVMRGDTGIVFACIREFNGSQTLIGSATLDVDCK